MIPAQNASITIIAVPAEDPDSFEAMYGEERRHRSAGWKTFPAHSGQMLDPFLMKATDSDPGVFELASSARNRHRATSYAGGSAGRE